MVTLNTHVDSTRTIAIQSSCSPGCPVSNDAHIMLYVKERQLNTIVQMVQFLDEAQIVPPMPKPRMYKFGHFHLYVQPPVSFLRTIQCQNNECAGQLFTVLHGGVVSRMQ